MKQSIRIECFETNSSSYHTITIKRTSQRPKLRDIEIGKETEITGVINKRCIGDTSSYLYTSLNKLDKANMLVRYFGYEFDDWLYSEEIYNQFKGMTDDEKQEKVLELAYEFPYYKAIVECISNYTGCKTILKPSENRYWSSLFNCVSDDGMSIETILGINSSITHEELVEKFNNIIFDDDYVIIEECESNE